MKQTGLVRQCKGEGHYFIGIMVEGREKLISGNVS